MPRPNRVVSELKFTPNLREASIKTEYSKSEVYAESNCFDFLRSVTTVEELTFDRRSAAHGESGSITCYVFFYHLSLVLTSGLNIC